MKTWLKTDIAYAAGFVDGEGCFYINQATSGKWKIFRTVIYVSQTNEEVLQLLCSQFGGSVCRRKSLPRDKKAIWIWTVHNRSAEHFVKLVHPYLKVKREQAALFLDMCKRKRENGAKHLHAQEVQERHELGELYS